MTQKVRAVLCLAGFVAVTGIVMSDRFQNLREAVPESLYYCFFGALLLGMTVLGFYSWWQHYNGRQLNPTVDRLKKWVESPAWWNWPF